MIRDGQKLFQSCQDIILPPSKFPTISFPHICCFRFPIPNALCLVGSEPLTCRPSALDLSSYLPFLSIPYHILVNSCPLPFVRALFLEQMKQWKKLHSTMCGRGQNTCYSLLTLLQVSAFLISCLGPDRVFSIHEITADCKKTRLSWNFLSWSFKYLKTMNSCIKK